MVRDDEVLGLSYGIVQMRASTDRLWGPVRRLQEAIDSGTLGGTDRVASQGFLERFYSFQVALGEEKTRLRRVRQTGDLGDLRGAGLELGRSYTRLHGRETVGAVLTTR